MSACSSVTLTAQGENLVEEIPKHIQKLLHFRKNCELWEWWGKRGEEMKQCVKNREWKESERLKI